MFFSWQINNKLTDLGLACSCSDPWTGSELTTEGSGLCSQCKRGGGSKSRCWCHKVCLVVSVILRQDELQPDSGSKSFNAILSNPWQVVRLWWLLQAGQLEAICWGGCFGLNLENWNLDMRIVYLEIGLSILFSRRIPPLKWPIHNFHGMLLHAWKQINQNKN